MVDHIGCGCYDAYYDRDSHDGDDPRTRVDTIKQHFTNLRNFCKYIGVPLEDDGTLVTGYLMDTDGALCADPSTGEYAVHLDEALWTVDPGAHAHEEPGQVTTSRWFHKKIEVPDWLKATGKIVVNVASQASGGPPIFRN